jgi:phage terminase large subunit-like protein
LNEVQRQRALADLQNKDLNVQANAVQKLIDLNEQKYQAERRPLELESLKGTIAGQGQQRKRGATLLGV